MTRSQWRRASRAGSRRVRRGVAVWLSVDSVDRLLWTEGLADGWMDGEAQFTVDRTRKHLASVGTSYDWKGLPFIVVAFILSHF